MDLSSFLGLDTIIAMGLIGIVVIVFMVYRMGFLPKKSLPFVIGALLAGFGIYLFRASKRKALMEDIEQKEKEIKKMEKDLKTKKNTLDLSDQEVDRVLGEAKKERDAIKKELLENELKTKEEKKRINEMTNEELDNHVMNILNNPGSL